MSTSISTHLTESMQTLRVLHSHVAQSTHSHAQPGRRIIPIQSPRFCPCKSCLQLRSVYWETIGAGKTAWVKLLHPEGVQWNGIDVIRVSSSFDRRRRIGFSSICGYGGGGRQCAGGILRRKLSRMESDGDCSRSICHLRSRVGAGEGSPLLFWRHLVEFQCHVVDFCPRGTARSRWATDAVRAWTGRVRHYSREAVGEELNVQLRRVRLQWLHLMLLAL
jgi:hypothetical protein